MYYQNNFKFSLSVILFAVDRYGNKIECLTNPSKPRESA